MDRPPRAPRAFLTGSRLAALLVAACALGLGLFGAEAQALVVSVNPNTGPEAVTYPANNQNYVGITLPGATGPTGPNLSAIPTGVATSSATCLDASGAPVIPSYGPPPLAAPPYSPLCFHSVGGVGGSVVHKNDTYALYWDPQRDYFETTKAYLDQFLQNVATDSQSGGLNSPYPIGTQYSDTTGHAQYASRFRGAYTDFGAGSGGNNFPAVSGCPVSGASFDYLLVGANNAECITRAQIETEIKAMIAADGLPTTTSADGYTPIFMLFTPPGVETCVDASGSLCMASYQCSSCSVSTATYQFCSYHSHLTMPDGTQIAYLVQPWVAETPCDDPAAPVITYPIVPSVEATDLAIQMISPLAQAHIATTVNPQLDAWFSDSPSVFFTAFSGFANTGGEISDNGCSAPALPPDSSIINGAKYPIQPMFNNGGVIIYDLNSLPCWLQDSIASVFVAPSPVSPGDIVALDGSTSYSTLNIASYAWDFGDGTTASGPTTTHVYTKLGTYTVKLTVTDRGGLTATSTQTIAVVGIGAPVNTAPPGITCIDCSGSATPAVGNTLECSTGTWGAKPTSFTYQWNRDGTPIVAAVSLDYKVTSADAGHSLTCTVTAVNAAGSTPATSTVTIAIGRPPPPPPPLHASVKLTPESFKKMSVAGVALTITANRAADGVVVVSISRSTAKRAHIKYSRAATVVVGHGTLTNIGEGATTFHLRLGPSTIKKLKHLGHVTLMLKLTLVDSSGAKQVIDVAGRY